MSLTENPTLPTCSKCGANVQSEDKFCGYCGSRLAIESELGKAEKSRNKNTSKPSTENLKGETTTNSIKVVGQALLVLASALFLAYFIDRVASTPERPRPAQLLPGETQDNSSDPRSELHYELTSFETSWTLSRGLWEPEITMTVRNTGARDIDKLYFKAVFLDAKGTLKGDDVLVSVNSIPAGSARGPIFMRGYVGYTSDFVFLVMGDDSNKWRFDLYEGGSYTGPWTKIKSGLVELPEMYRSLSTKEPKAPSPLPSLQSQTVNFQALQKELIEAQQQLKDAKNELTSLKDKFDESQRDLSVAQQRLAIANREVERMASSRSQSGSRTPAATARQAAEPGVYEIVRATPVYEEPSATGRVLLQISKGTRVEVVRSSGDWLEVRSKDGRPGFVRYDDAIFVKPEEPLGKALLK